MPCFGGGLHKVFNFVITQSSPVLLLPIRQDGVYWGNGRFRRQASRYPHVTSFDGGGGGGAFDLYPERGAGDVRGGQGAEVARPNPGGLCADDLVARAYGFESGDGSVPGVLGEDGEAVLMWHGVVSACARWLHEPRGVQKLRIPSIKLQRKSKCQTTNSSLAGLRSEMIGLVFC
jgi:hypothetical protein